MLLTPRDQYNALCIIRRARAFESLARTSTRASFVGKQIAASAAVQYRATLKRFVAARV